MVSPAHSNALIMANLEVIEEVLGMADEAVAFDRLVEKMGWAAKWEARGEAKGRAEGEVLGEARGKKSAWKEAIDLLKQGTPSRTLNGCGLQSQAAGNRGQTARGKSLFTAPYMRTVCQ
jgi:hypothetical protein